MADKYAAGKHAWGICGRSGRKMLLNDMIFDGNYPNMRVDPAWWEPKHPQERLQRLDDPVALWRPSPEVFFAPTPPVLEGTLAVDQASIALDWTEAVSDVSQVDSYFLWRSVDGGAYVLIATTTVVRDFLGAITEPGRTYLDEDVDLDHTYSYYVVGHPVQGPDSDPSNIVTFVTVSASELLAPVITAEMLLGVLGVGASEVSFSITADSAGGFSGYTLRIPGVGVQLGAFSGDIGTLGTTLPLFPFEAISGNAQDFVLSIGGLDTSVGVFDSLTFTPRNGTPLALDPDDADVSADALDGAGFGGFSWTWHGVNNDAPMFAIGEDYEFTFHFTYSTTPQVHAHVAWAAVVDPLAGAVTYDIYRSEVMTFLADPASVATTQNFPGGVNPLVLNGFYGNGPIAPPAHLTLEPVDVVLATPTQIQLTGLDENGDVLIEVVTMNSSTLHTSVGLFSQLDEALVLSGGDPGEDIRIGTAAANDIGAYTLVSSTDTLAYNDVSITPPNFYFYKVRARTAGDESVDSNIADAISLQLSDSFPNLALDYSQVPDFYGESAFQWQIWRTDSQTFESLPTFSGVPDKAAFTLIATVGGTVFHYLDDEPPDYISKQYAYFVRTLGLVATHDTNIALSSPPELLFDLNVTDPTVTTFWEELTEFGGFPVDHFDIYRLDSVSRGDGPHFDLDNPLDFSELSFIGTVGGGTFEFEDTEPPDYLNIQYAYGLLATNTNGDTYQFVNIPITPAPT